MNGTGRLQSLPSEIIDRGRSVSFQFNGRACEGLLWDTIASALAASGQKVFSRSFKYHRPRGLLCASGRCPNCLMTVDGVPSVRTCTAPLREGMRVESQNCWPSLEYDSMSMIERFDFLLPVGFYYKLFARPPWAWKAVEPMIRRVAGLGSIAPDAPDTHFERVHLHRQVVVVGGGPAGISTALAAAEAGAEVLLIDDQPELGGRLRYTKRLAGLDSSSAESGFALALRLRQQVAAQPRIDVLTQALAFGAYEDNLLAVRHHDTLVEVRAGQLVVATGAFEFPPVFDGNDLPGVMLGEAARRLVHLYAVKPGTKAVVCGSDEDALALALELHEAGIAVEAIADSRPNDRGVWKKDLEQARITLFASHRIVAAHGGRAVDSAELAVFDAGGEVTSSPRRRIECDLIVVATQMASSVELLRQSGVLCQYDELTGQMIPLDDLPGISSAGRLRGMCDLKIETLQGRIAGLQSAGGPATQIQTLRAELATLEQRWRAENNGSRSTVLLPDSKSQFVCFCEDVKQKDLTQAIAEGFEELETLKRYSTVTMGPCQGRMCLMNSAAVCAARTGRTLRETGATTARPPVQPVSLGLLAGPHHSPVKFTPMHHKHVEAGATLMDAGRWKRPRGYTKEAEEWRAVRERVGMIDVSTLGKIDLQGRDAGILLDKVYTHVFSNLPPGKVRYGVVCNEEGVILDDGTVGRIAEDRYFITTTTGNVDFMEAWLKSWLAGSGLCAHVANITADYAAVNVAGPRARDTLRKLTDIDLSTEAFRYMACRQGQIAGVPATLLRIGFVGETGWEIHFPAAYGEYMWDTLLEAGAEFGIQPFGVDAQRTLRLEKKHIIIGQDTDSLSSVFDVEMAWCLKFDKADFIGKSGLEHVRQRDREQTLAGFVADWGEPAPEGSAVLDDGRPVGRITSCRRSPYVGGVIGMAWLPPRLADEGKSIQVFLDGKTESAKVALQPFYDPEGRRLRD